MNGTESLEIGRNILGWPKGSFSFFHKMALVAFGCL